MLKSLVQRTIVRPMPIAGLLRDSVLHRCARYCKSVRGRLLISQLKQSVTVQELDSGGRGRKFESSHPDQILKKKIGSLTRQGEAIFFCGCRSGDGTESKVRTEARSADRPSRTASGPSSHPDQYFLIQINPLQRPQVGHCFLRELLCGSFAGILLGPAIPPTNNAKQLSQLARPLSEYGSSSPNSR